MAKKCEEGKEWFSCRDVLWYLVFCGFAVSSLLKANINLAIIAMVIPRPEAAAVAQCSHDVQTTAKLSELMVNGSLVTNIGRQNVSHSIDSASFELTEIRPENTTPVNSVHYPDRFAWSEYEQGLALGGIFWLPWITQLPAGLLARRYGTKLVFGWGNLADALLGFLLPLCAQYHLYAFVLVRVIQGFFSGFVRSSMHNMTAKWIPPDERSKFISSYLGVSAGVAISYPLSAMLSTWFGWESVFYVTSALGIIWYIPWYYLAYDTPHEHPRISEAEKTYILKRVEHAVDVTSSSKPVPWKAILTSGPLWITAIASCGGQWGVLTLTTEAPSYFSYVHGWNISTTGALSAIPQVMRILFGYVFSSIADWLLRTKRMSVTKLRKFAVFLCNGVQGIFLLGLAFSGCHPILAIVLIISGTAASGSLSAGTLASCIDLSPNYASIILGICNCVTVAPGFLSPLIVGILTNNNQTIEQWRLVFLINVAILFSTGVLYMFVGTSELQPWNDAGDKEKGEEFQNLRSNGAGVDYDQSGALNAELENSTYLVQMTGNHVAKIHQ